MFGENTAAVNSKVKTSRYRLMKEVSDGAFYNASLLENLVIFLSRGARQGKVKTAGYRLNSQREVGCGSRHFKL